MKESIIKGLSLFLQIFLSLQLANFVDEHYNPTGGFILPLLTIFISLLPLAFLAAFIEDKLLGH